MEPRGTDRPTFPVAIGGAGGSGTRVVAKVLRDSGFFMGADLNDACDNLHFTLLFKHLEIRSATDEDFSARLAIFLNSFHRGRPFTDLERSQILGFASADCLQHPSEWLRERAHSFLDPEAVRNEPAGRWGWKEPNTHVIIDRLLEMIPDLRYIHVVRNGLDMCVSHNQNQIRLWGSELLCSVESEPTPAQSLRYWCLVHRRILDHVEHWPSRILLVNYDELCSEPVSVIPKIFEFAGIPFLQEDVRRLAATVVPPDSIGRFKAHPLAGLLRDDIAFVNSLGFDTDHPDLD